MLMLLTSAYKLCGCGRPNDCGAIEASPWNFLFMTYLALVVEDNVVLGPKV